MARDEIRWIREDAVAKIGQAHEDAKIALQEANLVFESARTEWDKNKNSCVQAVRLATEQYVAGYQRRADAHVEKISFFRQHNEAEIMRLKYDLQEAQKVAAGDDAEDLAADPGADA